MDTRLTARMAAVLFVVFAIVVAIIELTREPAASAPAPQSLGVPTPDALRAGQRRCQGLGEAAAGDAECLRVWAETRDRFLGRKAVSSPASGTGR